VPLEGGEEGETSTRGLETLAAACRQYVQQGARFAKWRAALKVKEGSCPSELAVRVNAEQLAEYAAVCQVGWFCCGVGGSGSVVQGGWLVGFTWLCNGAARSSFSSLLFTLAELTTKPTTKPKTKPTLKTHNNRQQAWSL